MASQKRKEMEGMALSVNATVDALIDAAMSFAATGGTIDRVHLVPVRGK